MANSRAKQAGLGLSEIRTRGLEIVAKFDGKATVGKGTSLDLGTLHARTVDGLIDAGCIKVNRDGTYSLSAKGRKEAQRLGYLR